MKTLTSQRPVSPRASTPTYRSGDRCPGCTHKQWLVVRVMAECAVCATAVPLGEAA
jgi:hypothetical protein